MKRYNAPVNYGTRARKIKILESYAIFKVWCLSRRHLSLWLTILKLLLHHSYTHSWYLINLCSIQSFLNLNDCQVFLFNFAHKRKSVRAERSRDTRYDISSPRLIRKRTDARKCAAFLRANRLVWSLALSLSKAQRWPQRSGDNRLKITPRDERRGPPWVPDRLVLQYSSVHLFLLKRTNDSDN